MNMDLADSWGTTNHTIVDALTNHDRAILAHNVADLTWPLRDLDVIQVTSFDARL